MTEARLSQPGIRAGGYGIVVTLLDTWELDFLHVAGMGESVAANGMSWWHLPVIQAKVGSHISNGQAHSE